VTMQPQFNGAAVAALGIVTQPTISVHMAGHLRLQVPCSKPVQAIYDLQVPDLKANPGNVLEIKTEAEREGSNAAAALNQVLMNSPQLKPLTPQIGLSYAIVSGKLFYLFMLPVRSA
jgi:hypothetical protein